MRTIVTPEVKDLCKLSPNKVHAYQIQKHSDKKTKIPIWKCRYCDKEVKST